MKFKHQEMKKPKPSADEKELQRDVKRDVMQRPGMKRDPKAGKSYKKNG